MDENANLNTLYILKEQLHAWWESKTVELMQERLEARCRIMTQCSMLLPDIHSQDRRRTFVQLYFFVCDGLRLSLPWNASGTQNGPFRQNLCYFALAHTRHFVGIIVGIDIFL